MQKHRGHYGASEGRNHMSCTVIFISTNEVQVLICFHV